MWKNNVEPDRSHDNMAHANCMQVTKAANTHSECVILIAFPLQQWVHKPPSLLRYTYSTLPVLLQLVAFCHQ